jgi:hypothetical protein
LEPSNKHPAPKSYDKPVIIGNDEWKIVDEYN